MNRQRLAQLLTVVAVTAIGGTVWTIYEPDAGVTAADLADAGLAPTHMATCDVRLDDECMAQYGLPRYTSLQFPAAVVGATHEASLPPSTPKVSSTLHRCIEVVDWDDCTLAACDSTCRTRWASANPYRVIAAAASKWVVPDCSTPDGGWDNDHAQVDCLATGVLGRPDGGARWRGCNVLPRALSQGAACLDSVGSTENGEALR